MGGSEVVNGCGMRWFPRNDQQLPRIYIRAESDIIPTSSVGVERQNHWRDILVDSTTDRASDPFRKTCFGPSFSSMECYFKLFDRVPRSVESGQAWTSDFEKWRGGNTLDPGFPRTS